MIGQQHQVDVDGVHLGRVRLGAVQHIQEIGRDAQIGVGRNRFFAFADASPGGDDRRNSGGEPDRFAAVGLRTVVVRLWIEHAQQGNRRTQHTHRVRADGEGAHSLDDLGWQGHLGDDRTAQAFQLGDGGEFAVPEQVDHLFEGSIFGQIGDVIAAVDQPPDVSLDTAEPGVGNYDPFQTFLLFFCHRTPVSSTVLKKGVT